jgi:hypothetical protein
LPWQKMVVLVEQACWVAIDSGYEIFITAGHE